MRTGVDKFLGVEAAVDELNSWGVDVDADVSVLGPMSDRVLIEQ